MPKLDFLCIGAGKSGTTSLFYYLKDHPQIYIPEEKELPFFDKDVSVADFELFYKKYFSSAVGKICGKITPSYMSTPDIPARIHKFFPDIKIIVLLRNPIDRAYSYYLMKRKKSKEMSTFHDEAINQIEGRPENEMIAEYYVRRGLYGKVLGEYLKYFSKEQILIIFSEDLSAKRSETVDSIFNFISVEKGYRAPTINREHYKGGNAYLFKDLHKKLYSIALIRNLFRLIPRKLGLKIKRWYLMDFNTVGKIPPMEPRTRFLLKEYYKSDIIFLENQFKVIVPWQEFSV